MFSDRRAKFRSDETLEREAEAVRRWGNITAHSKFNVVHLIEGAVRKNLPFRLDINFSDPRLEHVPAFVAFPKAEIVGKLCVRKSTWTLAEANQDEARFILSHEIGHLKMHQYDAFAFSSDSESNIRYLQEGDRAEPQANKFADRLLAPESMLVDFTDPGDIADYFNVPFLCAQRRFEFIQDKRRRQVGEACPECANFTLVRNGTCLKCETCGGTTGCS